MCNPKPEVAEPEAAPVPLTPAQQKYGCLTPDCKFHPAEAATFEETATVEVEVESKEYPAIVVEYTHDGATTFAKVWPAEESAAYEERIFGLGKATCAHDDVFDPAIGEGIAAARGLIDMGKILENIWESRVVTKAQAAAEEQALTKLFEAVLDLMEQDAVGETYSPTKGEAFPGKEDDSMAFIEVDGGLLPVSVRPSDMGRLIRSMQGVGVKVQVDSRTA